jgi:hypothetical protein
MGKRSVPAAEMIGALHELVQSLRDTLMSLRTGGKPRHLRRERGTTAIP